MERAAGNVASILPRFSRFAGKSLKRLCVGLLQVFAKNLAYCVNSSDHSISGPPLARFKEPATQWRSPSGTPSGMPRQCIGNT